MIDPISRGRVSIRAAAAAELCSATRHVFGESLAPPITVHTSVSESEAEAEGAPEPGGGAAADEAEADEPLGCADRSTRHG